MITLTKKEWNGTPADYKGIFEDYQGLNPELKGVRTLVYVDSKTHATVLGFENIHFQIV